MLVKGRNLGILFKTETLFWKSLYALIANNSFVLKEYFFLYGKQILPFIYLPLTKHLVQLLNPVWPFIHKTKDLAGASQIKANSETLITFPL